MSNIYKYTKEQKMKILNNFCSYFKNKQICSTCPICVFCELKDSDKLDETDINHYFLEYISYGKSLGFSFDITNDDVYDFIDNCNDEELLQVIMNKADNRIKQLTIEQDRAFAIDNIRTFVSLSNLERLTNDKIFEIEDFLAKSKFH